MGRDGVFGLLLQVACSFYCGGGIRGAVGLAGWRQFLQYPPSDTDSPPDIESGVGNNHP
jgi:hypothetical protein